MNRWGILAGIVVLIISLLVHPRLRLLFPWILRQAQANYLVPPQDAKKLWQDREMASIGYFEKIAVWPDNNLTRSYPVLRQNAFRQGVRYFSEGIESIDLIMTPDEAQAMLDSLGQTPSINTVRVFQISGHQYVLGYFDAQTAKETNGFIENETLNNDYVWLQLAEIK